MNRPPQPISRNINRAAKRERKIIDDKLTEIVREFIVAVKKIHPEATNGLGENIIAIKYIEGNDKWKLFCHKKWEFNKPLIGAFEASLKANINYKPKNKNHGSQPDSEEFTK